MKKHSKVAFNLWQPPGLKPIVDKDYGGKAAIVSLDSSPSRNNRESNEQLSGGRVASVFQIDKPAERKNKVQVVSVIPEIQETASVLAV